MGILTTNSTDAYNLSLPSDVRQLLLMSGGDYETERAERAALNWRYYKNKQYERDFLEENSTETAAGLQQAKQLWAGVTPLFNLCTEAANIDRRLCFKKARPLPVTKDDALELRLRQKWETDRWGQRVKLSPLYGAITGLSYLRVIEGYLEGNPEAPSRLEVYSPEIMTVLRDQHNQNRIIAAKIEYQYYEETGSDSPTALGGLLGWISAYLPAMQKRAMGLSPNEDPHIYTMIITEESYYTFRDGQLHRFGSMGNSWANRLGVVPVVEVPFSDIGEDCGLPTFQTILPTLDSVNELLTMFGQILKIHADPALLAFGIDPQTQFEKTLVDGTTVWHIPLPTAFLPNSNAQPPRLEYLEWKGSNVAALLEFLKFVTDNCEAALPETRLIKSQARAGSGYEVSLDLQLLVDKIEEIRETQFDAAEDALQMALVADDAADELLQPEEVRARIAEARSKYDMTIWADTVLPRDRSTEAQIINTNLADKVTSRRQARLDSGKTYIEADRIASEIEADFQDDLNHAKAIAKAEAELMAEFGSAAPSIAALLPPKERVGSSALTAGKSSATGSPTTTTPKANANGNGSNTNKNKNNGNGSGKGTQPTAQGAGAKGLANPRVQSQPNKAN